MFKKLFTLAACLILVMLLCAWSYPSQVTVTDFGAVANDNIDDSSAFNKAFIVLGNGGTLLVPPGEYVIGENLSVPDGINVSGINKPTLVFKSTLTLQEVNDVTFSNIQFISSQRYVCFCKITNSNNITFQGCEVDGNNGVGYGFFVLNATKVNFINNEIKNFWAGKGIEFVGCVDCSAIENYVHHTGRAGISVSNTNTNCKVLRNKLEYNVNNFTVADGVIDLYGPNNINTVIDGNIISDYGSDKCTAVGIRISGSFNTKCVNNVVRSSPYAFALILVQSRNGIVDGNVDIASNVLNLKDGICTNVIRVINANNIKVRDNVIKYDTLTKNPDCAIMFRNNINNLLCEGNVITSSSPTDYFPSVGIAIPVNGESFENIVIKNNYLKVTGKSIMVAEKWQSVTISGNVIINP